MTVQDHKITVNPGTDREFTATISESSGYEAEQEARHRYSPCQVEWRDGDNPGLPYSRDRDA